MVASLTNPKLLPPSVDTKRYLEISMLIPSKNGPHSIYLYANSNFQHYSSGIFDDESCPKFSYNHAVVNVGYSTSEGYWTIRNSWAASWGEDGHIRIKSGSNICNCEKYAWYPEI